jgi:hypothetical protein
VPDCHDSGTEAALKRLIRHLVLSFPETSVLSRQVGDRYHVFVIVPYDGTEKTIQVERAWLVESARSIQASEGFLEQLNLPVVFETHERYELRAASSPQAMGASRSPANEGWSAEADSGTVCHGPIPLSGPSSPTHPGAVSRAHPN